MSERIRASVEIQVAVEMDLDPEWIDRTQTDEWRNTYYDLTRHEAAEMIADNMIRCHRPINRLDGWADIEPHVAQAFHDAVKKTWIVGDAMLRTAATPIGGVDE